MRFSTATAMEVDPKSIFNAYSLDSDKSECTCVNFVTDICILWHAQTTPKRPAPVKQSSPPAILLMLEPLSDIFHKNREISILMMKKETARFTLPQEATERTKQGETKKQTKNETHRPV
jgi:hypothetical protein